MQSSAAQIGGDKTPKNRQATTSSAGNPREADMTTPSPRKEQPRSSGTDLMYDLAIRPASEPTQNPLGVNRLRNRKWMTQAVTPSARLTVAVPAWSGHIIQWNPVRSPP